MAVILREHTPMVGPGAPALENSACYEMLVNIESASNDTVRSKHEPPPVLKCAASLKPNAARQQPNHHFQLFRAEVAHCDFTIRNLQFNKPRWFYAK